MESFSLLLWNRKASLSQWDWFRLYYMGSLRKVSVIFSEMWSYRDVAWAWAALLAGKANRHFWIKGSLLIHLLSFIFIFAILFQQEDVEMVFELIAGHRAAGISSPELPFSSTTSRSITFDFRPVDVLFAAVGKQAKVLSSRWSCVFPLMDCIELWWLVNWKDQCCRYWSAASNILYLHTRWWYYGPVIDLKPFNDCPLAVSQRMECSGLLDKAPPKMDEQLKQTASDGAACAN